MKAIQFASMSLVLGFATAFFASGAEAKGGFKIIHTFAGGANDGASPYGGVAPDGHGGFYVATDGGGSVNRGAMVVVHKSGTSQILHSFIGGSDGQNADGTPLLAQDALVGTTRFGGEYGCGTVYSYTVSGGGYTESSFKCGSRYDLAFPFSGLTYAFGFPIGTATNGNIDGRSDNGGFYDWAGGRQNPQCQFSGSDGSQPFAGITEADGALYFAASAGGSSNLGTVAAFIDSCTLKVLHNFAGGSDGANPYGTLVYNNRFLLYGTTRYGGVNNLGTVFRIDISGGNYTVLHTFQGICCGNSDGSFPQAGLTLNPKDGMFYGTTINGGGSSDNGTVFKINPDTGAETVVHTFSGADGAHPYAALYIDAKGKVYGTTLQGGAHNAGVVFRLKT